jgi:tripartite-type tricarboxylate transporter receptor subunit TctC
MKVKLILVLLALLCSSAYAELSKTITVYSSALSGAKTDSCRLVMDVYARQHNANIVWMIKPGAEGLIATQLAQQESNFALLCGSAPEMVFNNSKFPGNEALHSDLTVVSTLFVGPLSFYTGDKNPYPDLLKMLEVKKAINVGYHSSLNKTIAEQVFKNYPGLDVNWILYKAAPESYSQLKDGTLDMYLSSGSFEEHVRGGQLKSLGFVNGDKTIMGLDLSKQFPIAASLPNSICLIAYKSKTNTADLIELNRRLQSIITSPEITEKARSMAQFPLPGTMQQSNAYYESFRNFIKK